jgi:purine-nucleoside phosphorylase
MNKHRHNGHTFLSPDPAKPDGVAPLLQRNDHAAPSIFRPENMLREARRQKGIGAAPVPEVCVIDPDGDIVDHVRRHHAAQPSAHWACYHTRMWEWTTEGIHYGIVGHAVGSSFSVLVAEQLFASGCKLLLSVASAGQITDIAPPPYHILIARALRDEGTSYHYLPPTTFAEADPALIAIAAEGLVRAGCPFHVGDTWTTDAPFRETAHSIAMRRDAGILAVEMEAAALYAFGAACRRAVICLAHVSNRLGCVEGDFEKGHANGACSSIELVTAIASTLASAAVMVGGVGDHASGRSELARAGHP